MRKNIPTQNIIFISDTRMKQIKGGVKTATLREGIRNYSLGPAIIINDSDEKDNLSVVIWKIECLPFGKMTEQLCKEQGYSSLDEMKKTLLEIYPNLREDSFVTNIVFSVKK